MTGPGGGRFVLEGRSTDDGGPIRLTVEDGVIGAIEHRPDSADGDWISPGWIDLQVNGFEGHDPNAVDVQPDATVQMVRALWHHGVTAVCPTIITNAEEHMLAALRAVARACEMDPLVARSIPGIHVEGPHIATEDGPRGAHPLAHVRPPDLAEYRRWQEAAGGRIRIITLSPEYPGAAGYIEGIVADGVIASIGHTAASSEQIRAAVDAGARWSTHLGNGAHALLRRHPNYIWDQLAEDRLAAGLIFDGHHLPPAVMQTMIRAKGLERCVLVSDALHVAGLEPGEYALPDGASVTLHASGRLELTGTPFLAGCATGLPTCVSNAVRHAGLSVPEAVRTVTRNPAALLGLEPSESRDSLRVGARANLTVFRQDPQDLLVSIVTTVVDGTVVHGNVAA
ncbi:MAG TPA: amidohydrolase family protein [Candidatus Limnocylindrales bacterium]|nr:amidohydrolase family protein [Candidatus Limnocylindrales bacterium]